MRVFFYSEYKYIGLRSFNTLNAELNPICHLLALLQAHPILHISRIRVNQAHPILHISRIRVNECGAFKTGFVGTK